MSILPTSPTPLLHADAITLSLAHKPLFTDISVTLQAGELWGLIGPNGCGKTTLLHTLAGLRPPSAGNLFLYGKAIATLSMRDIAKMRAILLQNSPAYFPQTVYDFCAGGRYPHSSTAKENEAIIWHALTLMGLEKKATQTIQTLSGGELRRLSIATVITQQPQLYLLDEPFNHLDPFYQIALLDYLHELIKIKKICVVMTLHNINLLHEHCTHVMLPTKNQKILAGETKELIHAASLSQLYRCTIQETATGVFSLATKSGSRAARTSSSRETDKV